MSQSKFIQLSREQLRLLQEAKRQVRKEFDRELKLQRSDVLDQLYGLALSSKQGVLMDIYKQLNPNTSEPNELNMNRKKVVKKPVTSAQKEIKVGDIVDGNECVGLYRGQPVFRQAN